MFATAGTWMSNINKDVKLKVVPAGDLNLDNYNRKGSEAEISETGI
jgi:hypothetical protein